MPETTSHYGTYPAQGGGSFGTLRLGHRRGQLFDRGREAAVAFGTGIGAVAPSCVLSQA